MGWSKSALGANKSADSQTNKQNLLYYMRKHDMKSFNIVDCYNATFKKQSDSDKSDMKSISTLNKYLRDMQKMGYGGDMLQRAIDESRFLNTNRAKRLKEEKAYRDEYLSAHGIVLGDKNLG